MHSSLVRIQNIFGFFTTVGFVVATLVALSVVLIPQAPTADITVRNLQVVKGRPHYYSTKKTEYASIRFDIDADLSSLFTWNTKQLFVWVTATYPSPNGTVAEAVIWDSIIPSLSQSNPPSIYDILPYDPRSPAQKKKAKKAKASPRASTSTGPPGKISVRNAAPKYKISDPSGHLASQKNVTLRLGYNVQPWVGALTWPLRDGSFWRWLPLAGGRSKSFNLPAIKGADKGKEKVVGKGEVPRA